MRLLLTAPTCPKGAVGVNLDNHLDLVRTAADGGCDLVLLPEMSLTGYEPAAAIDLGHVAIRTLAAASAGGPAICFGLVERAPTGPPYITQVVAADGDLRVVHRKADLGEGEAGHFQPGEPAPVFTLAGSRCVIVVCAEIGVDSPRRRRAEVVLGPAAPGLYGSRRRDDDDWRRGFDWWRGSLLDDTRLLGRGQLLAVSTQSGATVDEDFPGWAALLGPGRTVLAELPGWREGTLAVTA